MFSMILGLSAFQLRSKIDKKTSQDRSKFKPKIGQHLDPFFDGFWDQLGSIWEGFGGQVGAKLAPNGTRTRPHNQSKKRLLFGRPPERILINFWWILGPTWGGQRDPTKQLFGDLLALGAKMRPRPLQEPYKRPQEPPRAQLW